MVIKCIKDFTDKFKSGEEYEAERKKNLKTGNKYLISDGHVISSEQSQEYFVIVKANIIPADYRIFKDQDTKKLESKVRQFMGMGYKALGPPTPVTITDGVPTMSVPLTTWYQTLVRDKQEK